MENTTTETKQVVFDVSVYVVGVKKRCRKADRHILRVGTIPYDENLPQEEVNRLMDIAQGLLETNMKSVTRAKLYLTRTEIGDFFKSTELFDKRHKEFEIKTKLERVLA